MGGASSVDGHACGGCGSGGLKLGTARRSSIALVEGDAQCPCECTGGLELGEARRSSISVVHESSTVVDGDEERPNEASRPLAHPMGRRQRCYAPVQPVTTGRNQQIKDETSLMHYAVRSGNFSQMVDLVAKDADPMKKTARLQTPLMLAACANRADFAMAAVDFFLDVGVSLDALDRSGWSALMYACQNNNTEVAIHMLEKRVELNSQAVDGTTPLMLVVAGANSELMLALLERKANVHMKDARGHSPLFYACQDATPQMVKYLLRCKASTFDKSKAGVTPLFVAAEHGHKSIARALLQRRAMINERCKSSDTPLTMAIAAHMEDFGDWLLDMNAEVDFTNNDGETPYHIADKHGLLNLRTRIQSILKSAELRIKEMNFAESCGGKRDDDDLEHAVPKTKKTRASARASMNRFESLKDKEDPSMKHKRDKEHPKA